MKSSGLADIDLYGGLGDNAGYGILLLQRPSGP